MAQLVADTGVPYRRPRGTGYLLGLIAVLVLLSAFIFAGSAFRSLVGIPSRPLSDGAEPAGVPSLIDGTTADAATHPDFMPPARAATRLSAPLVTAMRAPQIVTEPAASPVLDPGLAKAEAAYRALQWSDAQALAARCATSDRAGARAREIAERAPILAQLFARLDYPDELSRGYDTHPSLVEIEDATGRHLVVPTIGADRDSPVFTGDPVAFIQARDGEGLGLLVQSGKTFIHCAHSGPITAVTRADLPGIIAAKRTEFAGRLRALENSADAGDAMRWYELAKFAYRNRLDERVAPALDRALDIDRDLVASVREDKAAQLFAVMIFHLQNGSRQRAAAFKTLMDQRYRDTEQGALASLYYAGDIPAVIARTRALDQQRAPMHQPAPAAPAAGDAAAAAAAFAAGFASYGKAMDMPATEQRNGLYHQSEALFTQAAQIYRRLCAAAPQDESLQMKVIEAQRLSAAARKYQTL